MRRAWAGCAALAALGLAQGCSPQREFDLLADVEVHSARLEAVNLVGIGIIGTGVMGDADLVVVPEDPQLDEIVVPVVLNGGEVGLVFDFPSVTVGGPAELDLPHRVVMGNELFGMYRGIREGVAVIVGAAGVHLANRSGIGIDGTDPTIGLVSLHVGSAWLMVKPDGDDTGASTGTSPYGTDATDTVTDGVTDTVTDGVTDSVTGTGETGATTAATGDTGVTPTGATGVTGDTGGTTATTGTTADTGAATAATGTTGDTGAAPPETGAGTGDTGASPTTPSTPTGGDRGDTGKGGDTGLDDCGCATGRPGVGAGVGWALALGLVRARRRRPRP